MYIPIMLMIVFGIRSEANSGKSEFSGEELIVNFESGEFSLSESEKQHIISVIGESEAEVRELLKGLPDTIEVTVRVMNRNVDIVGGVTGRADEHKPVGKIIVEISNVYPGGIEKAADDGLKTVIFHEFHHLTRGWSIYQNEFEPGIPIAAVNEGLAVVFAEEYTGVIQEANGYPEEAREWALELLELPADAEYSKWVSGIHPDGRRFIGYRTGNYLIRTAMQNSGMSILELSALSPDEIISLAGF